MVKKSLEPDFHQFELNLNDIRGPDTEFTIRVWDHDSDGGHDLIGELHTTLREWSFGEFRQALTRQGSSSYTS